jgi:hypothetical protein
VQPQELQAWLRVALLDDLNRFLTAAAGIYFALVGYVERQSISFNQVLRELGTDADNAEIQLLFGITDTAQATTKQ